MSFEVHLHMVLLPLELLKNVENLISNEFSKSALQSEKLLLNRFVQLWNSFVFSSLYCEFDFNPFMRYKLHLETFLWVLESLKYVKNSMYGEFLKTASQSVCLMLTDSCRLGIRLLFHTWSQNVMCIPFMILVVHFVAKLLTPKSLKNIKIPIYGDLSKTGLFCVVTS